VTVPALASLAGTIVDVREVGPRDGLQPEAPVSVADRVRLIDALLTAGVRHLEAVAFVSPRVVPAMAGAAEVLAALGDRPGVRLAALVPNRRGAELALAAGGLHELTVTISASEAYNQRNVQRSVAESLTEVADITALAGPAGLAVDAVVSCAFGSPYEGDLAPAEVAALGDRLLDAGCDQLTYADTTGMATPARVHALIDETGPAIGLHLHETRGTGLLNAWVGIERGVRRFDTSVGGLGGSPFAAGAAGNLATESLVAVLDDCGLVTGIDADALIEAAHLAGELVGRRVTSPVALAGPRTRRANEEGAG
jgi:hydroxymethylglutaryl-CoA lyase